MSKWLMLQGRTEINVESTWVCGCMRSISRAEYVHGSWCVPNMQTAQVTIPWCQTQCANRDIPALSEVILLLGLTPLKSAKLDSAIKLKLFILSSQVITLWRNIWRLIFLHTLRSFALSAVTMADKTLGLHGCIFQRQKPIHCFNLTQEPKHFNLLTAHLF